MARLVLDLSEFRPSRLTNSLPFNLTTTILLSDFTFYIVFTADMVDSQRQQAEERALKMKSVLVKTKKELAEAKKQVKKTCFPSLERRVYFHF